ncbi:MAG: hypothetical protein ACYSTS_16815 [Planctomycetota bacterium]
MQTSKLIVYSFVIFAVIVFTYDFAFCNGGKGKKTFYKGQIKLGEEEVCEFSTEIEQVLFRINSVENKYKVVRIKIINKSEKTLHLSIDKDKLELAYNEGHITGILDLSKYDPIFWDALDSDIRNTLVYPQIVEGKGEEENVFVFIPNPKLEKLPLAFIYTIESLPGRKEVDIYDTTPKFAH